MVQSLGIQKLISEITGEQLQTSSGKSKKLKFDELLAKKIHSFS